MNRLGPVPTWMNRHFNMTWYKTYLQLLWFFEPRNNFWYYYNRDMLWTIFNVQSPFYGQPIGEDGKDETSAVRRMAASVAPCIKINRIKINLLAQSIKRKIRKFPQICILILIAFFICRNIFTYRFHSILSLTILHSYGF